MVRVLLVDDHCAFRQALAFLLEREPVIGAVELAGTCAEARRHLHGIDIALLDLALPDGDGLELIEPLRASNPSGRVLVLTGTVEPEGVEGADAIVPKTAAVDEIFVTVRRLVGSGSPFSLD